MAKPTEDKQVAYFEVDGKPYGVPMDDEATLRAFVNDPNAKQISPYEVDVLVETAKMKEEPLLGRLEALGRGAVSGATVGLGQLAMDPVELAASKEAYPYSFYGADIGTGVGASLLSLGSLGKARLGIEAAKAAGKSTLAKEVLQGARALSKFTPTGMVSQVGGVGAKVPLALQGTNPVSATVRSMTPFVIQGAVEGAAGGFGYGAADKYLENPNATAEDLMAAGLDSASSGSVVGAAIPAGLTGVKTLAAGTAKGVSSIAKSIYGAAAEKYGEGFSDRLSAFIASETPEVQEALAQEIRKVVQYGENYSDIERRIKSVQESARIMREQGLESRDITKRLGDEIKEIKAQIKTLDSTEVKEANKKLKGLLNTQKKQTQEALKQGELALTDEALKPIREAAEQFEAILGPGGLGDTSRKVFDGKEYVAVSMIDDAIGRQLDDQIAQGAIGQPFELAQSMVQAQNRSIDGFRTVAATVLPDSAGRKELLGAINSIEQLRNQIQTKLKSGAVSVDDIKSFYLAERQLIRRLNEVPNAFRAKAVAADKAATNQVIKAKNFLESFHQGPVLGKAAQLERARNQAIAPMRQLINRLRGAKKPEQIQAGTEDIVSLAVNSNNGLDEISRVTQEIMGEEFSAKLMRSFGFAKSKAEQAQKSLEAIADFRSAANQVKTLQPGLDPVTVPDLPGTSSDEVISKAYDDLNNALMKSVDDFMSPETLQEAQRLKNNLDLLEDLRLSNSPGGNMFRARLNEKLQRDPNLIQAQYDDNIKELLQFRASSSPGGLDLLDAVAAIDLATGLPIPNSVSGAIIGLNRLKGKNLGALQSIARVAQTVRKTDENINKAADWALNAAISGKKPNEYIQGTSILGKILGVTIGKSYRPSEGE